jgi:hypothetical protein
MVKKDVWSKIVKHDDLIHMAQTARAFQILQVLSEASEPLSTSQISENIAKNSQGKIFLIPSTAKSACEIMRVQGMVDGKDIKSDANERKPVSKTLYSITKEGEKVLRGWYGFIDAFD